MENGRLRGLVRWHRRGGRRLYRPVRCRHRDTVRVREIAGWIADSVSIPVIMDGDTGHGGVMAVRRMVRECIRAGIAGIRIDDQPIEGKRNTQSAASRSCRLDQAVARYRAAVDMKNELDPNFVVMAQCYARDAAGGARRSDRAVDRLPRGSAGVDWVQFESPHSIDEIEWPARL